jgi:para-nitrobenzyl esterase
MRFVTTGVPIVSTVWPRFAPGKESLAFFGEPFHVVPLDDGTRFPVWTELLAQSGAALAIAQGAISAD